MRAKRSNPSLMLLAGLFRLQCARRLSYRNYGALLLAALLAAPALAQPARVTAMDAHGGLTLASGEQAVLANLITPDVALAQSWLAAHVLQQEVREASLGEDRYGRTLLCCDAAEKMLQDGAAAIYAQTGEIPARWWVAEAEARGAKRGLWAGDTLVLSPEATPQHLGEFHVVEGRLARLYRGKHATYLNFGEDWHTDFSIMVPAKLRRGMDARLAALKPGDRVRVRGTLYEENGPMIRLARAENLE